MTRIALTVSTLARMAACARPDTATAPQPRPVVITPPAAFLICQDAPSAPRTATKQSKVAEYVVRLHAAGQDCRDKLGAVRGCVEKVAD